MHVMSRRYRLNFDQHNLSAGILLRQNGCDNRQQDNPSDGYNRTHGHPYGIKRACALAVNPVFVTLYIISHQYVTVSVVNKNGASRIANIHLVGHVCDRIQYCHNHIPLCTSRNG